MHENGDRTMTQPLTHQTAKKSTTTSFVLEISIIASNCSVFSMSFTIVISGFLLGVRKVILVFQWIR